jgi:hypothetical protein
LDIGTEGLPSFLGIVNVFTVGATKDTPKLVNCLQDKIRHTANIQTWCLCCDQWKTAKGQFQRKINLGFVGISLRV